MTACIAVIGRNADQTVHTRFGLQPAICGVPLDEQRSRLDASLFAVVHFQRLDLHAAALRPADVHAQQHGSPVLALRTAGTGMDFDVGVIAVGFAGEQCLYLAVGNLLTQRPNSFFRLTDDAVVALSLAHLDQLYIVAESLGKAVDGVDVVLERLALAHQFLGFLGIVPEVAALGTGIEVLKPLYRFIPVKETPSAGRSPA